MFDRCRHTASSPITVANPSNGSAGLPVRARWASTVRGSESPAAMEATATYRVLKKKIIHTTTATPRAAGSSARMAPAEVATPLPPLKPSQNVKLCPNTLPSAASSIGHVGSWAVQVHHSRAATTGSNPFSTSMANTGMPIFFPSTRITLVAPIFPLPCWRISMPFHFATR